MEDALSVHQRPESEAFPMAGMDEASKQHVKQTRPPLPGHAGDMEKCDYEYERNVVSNLFTISSAPLLGWRYVEATGRHTVEECAKLTRDVVDVHFPKVDRIDIFSNQDREIPRLCRGTERV